MPRWWVNRSSALERVHRDERALDKLFRLAKELPERTRFSAAFTEGNRSKKSSVMRACCKPTSLRLV
jgi:hypothetical protein